MQVACPAGECNAVLQRHTHLVLAILLAQQWASLPAIVPAPPPLHSTLHCLLHATPCTPCHPQSVCSKKTPSLNWKVGVPHAGQPVCCSSQH